MPNDDDDYDRPRRRRRDDDEDDRPRRDDDFDDDFDAYDQPRRGRLSREQLRGIAGHQKVIILCVLIYLCLIPLQIVLPEDLSRFLWVALIPLGLTAAVFIFFLATNICSQSMGILLGILTLVPCVGLVVLLIINQKAVTILREHGIRVGLLGANSSDI